MKEALVFSSETYISGQIHRRDWIAGAAFALAAGCGRKKGTGYAGYALIATSGESSAAVVDLTAFRLLKAIPVPSPPTAILAGQHGFSYILSPASGSITVVDDGLRPVRSRKLADQLSQLRLLPDGVHLITVSPGTREVLAIEADSLKVIHKRRLQATPGSLDISPSGWIAVSSPGTGSVDLLNFQTGEWRHAALKAGTGALRFRADGKLLLAAGEKERILSVLRVPDLALIAELPLAMTPQNLCFTPDGGQLFVSGPGMDAVAIVFPYNALEVEQTVLAGRDPGVMACSGAPSFLFVANDSGSDVSILQVDTRKVIAVVQVGLRPRFIALTPDGQYALVLDELSGDLAVIHVAAIRANRDKTGAALFTLLPVGEKPVHCAFVPRQLG